MYSPTPIALIPVPTTADNNVGGKFSTYDIADIDPVTHLYYLADRSNASLDVISTQTLKFVTQVGGTGHLFSGQLSSNSISGPDGVVVARSPQTAQVFVGNGDSTLKSFQLGTYSQNPTVTTGPATAGRVDEMAFDPTRNVVFAANNAATPPFVTVVDAVNHTIIKTIVFDGTAGTPNATGGLEQPAYDPVTDKYYVSVVQIGGSGPGGVSEIDPKTNSVSRTFDFGALGLGAAGACGPTGLAVGTDGRMVVGCGDGSASILLDPRSTTGSIKIINGIGGEDGVFYDPSTNEYALAARFNPGGPVVGIVDGNGNLIQTLATTTNDHSVAIDPSNNDIFVAYGSGNAVCPAGCIAVFAVPEPASLPLVAGGVLAMLGLIGWRAGRS
ncbi:MAG: hypothetical protein NVS2B11_05140 [Acetobacteraceae bacterium]